MLVIKEILHRKFNFIIGIVAMMTIVSLVVAFYTVTKATKNETRLLTRDMGFNVRIIPLETDMNKFWNDGFSDLIMSDQVVDRLVDQEAVNYAHLTSTLIQKIMWQGDKIIVSGISSDEKEPSGAQKSKMIFAIPPDKVYVGYELAKKHKIQEGDLIEIKDKSFEVSKTLSEQGNNDDIKLYFDLPTLQVLLNLEGKVNEIMALNCMCSTEHGDPRAELSRELEKLAPETKVIMNSVIADARELQRKMTDKYFAIFFPIILFICAIWIASATMANVKERTHEIGILRAVGFTGASIIWMFILRALIIGIIGAVLGFILGTMLSIYLGPKIFKVSMVPVKPDFILLYGGLIFGALFSAISSLLPIVWAINQDSAQLLNES